MSAVLDLVPGHRTAIDGAVHIPLNLVAPSKTNPRKTFDPKTLDELAESVRKHGVLQPILVRSIDGAKKGQALYEIVAGERRWRASQKAEQTSIPSIVRVMTDFEVLELQVIENLQRDDLHPLEEAEGYQALMRRPDGLHGYATADELAARIHKSRSYVFGRLKLCALIDEARLALREDKISASTALLIARMPPAIQADATKKIVQGFGGEPMSYRSAREYLEREFMLKLGTAPFKITDETLHPTAGSCKSCGMRTGSNPDLFDDIKGADVCTHPPCFSAKKDAHYLRLVDVAKSEGKEVITGAAAKKAMPYDSLYHLNGFMPLDKADYNIDPKGKTLGKLLGKDAPPTIFFENPHSKELIEVVRTSDAMRVLKDKGLVKPRASADNDASKRAQAKAKATTQLRTAIAERAVAAVVLPKFDGNKTLDWLMPEVAAAMWEELQQETQKRAAKLLGWDKIESTDRDGRREKQMLERFKSLTGAQLGQAFVAMSIAGQVHVSEYYGGDGKRLERIAAGLGIDPVAVGRELKQTVPARQAAAKKAVAKKPAKPAATEKTTPKPVSKPPAAPPVKYSNAATGETWSGRGLQPAWLKAQLKSGKSLDDFAKLVETAPIAVKNGTTVGPSEPWPFRRAAS